ncbi:isopenicillin N synthase family oxygenase [Brasilonema octagenarum UFV-E1]|uniref:Isopenicillin N synthase family oxygenase n=1 Tax=Brasilonema sennae CENA114 TaxID=415709 RepID=A0A856ME82_9CYAN|nr:isopenicillin N synthase family oxygenase [Brasilonema sennae]QDL08429.1 isopenicillin N synthase family oxygenase [Brasilonema sennae CENA114]QDL14785.1 isopenicillin N synthase family oxygenase [Brasilonema octagenarum UFV-E1]
MVMIPVIDFHLFTSSDATDRQTVVQQIYQACHQIGFMYLKNTNISNDLIHQVLKQSKDFFDLPLTVKQQLAWTDEFSNQGYVGFERERLNPNNPGDLKEAFNIGKQKLTDIDVTDKLSSPAKNPHILNFYQACTELANNVLQAIALALKLPEDFFATNHNQQNHTLRLLHYPSLSQPPKLRQVRAGEHSDYGSITLLFQDEVGGLEVRTASGKWIAAAPTPDTIVVNTGDLMERWTNHVFCSTKHRVMIQNDDTLNQSRYSVAFFCHPNDDTEIVCLESCQRDKSPIYPPILAGEYLLSRLQATY